MGTKCAEQRIGNADQSLPSADALGVRIDSLNHDGRGVARVDGKVVFIDGALPGEDVLFRYRKRRGKYDSGAIVEILKPSPDRIVAACAHHGVCGGCSLQHLRPAAQIAAKEQVLRDALTRLAKVPVAHWLSPVTGPPWGYRRKARLGARLVPKKGGALVGFREKRSAFITPLEDCKTLDPRFAARLPDLQGLLSQLSCPDRIPQIEVAAGDDAAALVFRHLDPLTAGDVELLRAFGRRHGLQIHLQPKGPDSIHALWPRPAPMLSYRLPEHDIEILFQATDFTQVNSAVNRQMVDQAVALLDPQPRDRILDLFCGLGNFTLPLARRAGLVLGIEADARLVVRAEHNARHNGIENARFRAADLAGAAASRSWDDFNFNKVLLDPPRPGAMDVIKQLPSAGVERIVYVSCNPATLARDSEDLVHISGYRLSQAGVIDMFPHTTHVESIAVFDKT